VVAVSQPSPDPAGPRTSESDETATPDTLTPDATPDTSPDVEVAVPEEALAAIAPVEERLSHSFEDRQLLLAALTHASYANEHPEDPTETNERLEFLGDAVLGALVADALYERFPSIQEGRLTEWRAQLVCGPTLARVAQQLELGSALRLGRGEERTGGREREGNLERVYEATVGAIYLDAGLETARSFVARALSEEFDALERDPDILNPKGALQQLAQTTERRPEYVLIDQRGPEHDRSFTVEVRLGREVLGSGTGSSKQQAEKEAAREALEVLRSRADTSTSGRVEEEA
jgi:ribonuclease-3